MTIPFAEIQDRAASHAEELCARWLPKGAAKGGWWTCPVPWRTDRNPSFGVSLTTGRWKDFATGERGDFCDLYCKIFSVTPKEAAADIAAIVGHPWRPETS